MNAWSRNGACGTAPWRLVGKELLRFGGRTIRRAISYSTRALAADQRLVSTFPVNVREPERIKSGKLVSMTNVAKIALALAGLSLAATPVFAQSGSAPAAPAPEAPAQAAPTPPPAAKQAPGTIVLQTQEVTTPVTVKDSRGQLVLDLTDRNFKVYDNNVEQTIDSVDQGGDPISAVLVFETSTRIAALLPAIQKSGILFTQDVLGPTGDAAVLGYNDTVDHLLGFTSDRDQIEKTVKNLAPGTSGVKLYDALGEALHMLLARPDTRRRVIIVLGEALDTGSESKLGVILRNAQAANITIFTVGLSSTAATSRAGAKSGAPPSATPTGIIGGPTVPGEAATPEMQVAGGNVGGGDANLMNVVTWAVTHAVATVKERPLEVATAATGGLYQSTFRDHSVEDAIDEIGAELHGQYILSYRPSSSAQYGYHQIEVRVTRPNLTVRARPGYYLTAPGG
jgi:VWFA-related protein